MGAPVALPVTYPASRRKMAWVFALCVAMVAIGIWMFNEESGGTRVVAAVIAGFFGCGVLVALVGFLPRASYLRLTESGIEYVSLYRRNFLAWNDVDQFIPIVMHHNQFVAWEYAPGYEKQQTARKVSVAIAGIEAMLPDTYGHSHIELAALLNELRAKYGRTRAPAGFSRLSLPGTT